MNWIIGIGIALVVVAIMANSGPTLPAGTVSAPTDPHSWQTFFVTPQPGGLSKAPGPSINPTGVSVMITYDKP